MLSNESEFSSFAVNYWQIKLYYWSPHDQLLDTFLDLGPLFSGLYLTVEKKWGPSLFFHSSNENYGRLLRILGEKSRWLPHGFKYLGCPYYVEFSY